jgi:hypothetical protein
MTEAELKIAELRLEYLKLAAGLISPNCSVPEVKRVAGDLWDWGLASGPVVSKTKANIIKSVERLGASQNSEKDNS